MELWTEYEGTLVDGAFPLKRLLRPEGRSAFFSTLNGKGDSTVIRLVASHFDEEEILARWRGVTALAHPNILKLDHYGQLELDETTVVYAVMEPVDANLGEVLTSQRLMVAEAIQLAASLCSALDALHAHGFIHEHVEPANVFAVGDVVKLRSDCIREAPEGEAGQQAKRQDVQDLAVVLLQALTQQQTLQGAAHDLPLPAPFNLLVPNGISGAWGLADMINTLNLAAISDNPHPAQNNHREANTNPESNPISPISERASQLAPKANSISPVPISPVPLTHNVAAGAPSLPAQSPPAQPLASPDSAADPSNALSAGSEPLFPRRFTPPGDDPAATAKPGAKLLAGAGLLLLLAILITWYLGHRHAAGQNSATQSIASSAPANSSSATAAATQTATPNLAAANAHSHQAHRTPVTANQAQWRVVAYTYNYADQAQKKSATVQQRHPKLRPQVFTPTGRAPYLVTLGGAMSREQAFALVKEAKQAGLPQDIYAQNYSGDSR